MLKFITQRLLIFIPLALLLTVVVFGLVNGLLGDPAYLILGREAAPDTVQHLRHQMGFDRPLYVQYLDWLEGILRWDLGRSLRTHQLVSDAIQSRVPVTVELAIGALVVAVTLSIFLGAAAAVTRSRFVKHALTGLAITAVTLPNFLVGIMFILVFALHLRLFPVSGYVSLLQDPPGNVRVMMLPILTLGLGYVGSLTLILEASIRHVRQEPYIQTAHAKGLSESRILRRHVLKNSLIPFITNLGLSAARLFGGAVVTETVFALPGMGRLLVDSLLSRDFPTFQALLVIMTFGVLSLNLVMDIAYSFLDPRITYEWRI